MYEVFETRDAKSYIVRQINIAQITFRQINTSRDVH